MAYTTKYILSNIFLITFAISLIIAIVIGIYYYSFRERVGVGENLNDKEEELYRKLPKLLKLTLIIVVSSFTLNIILNYIYRIFFI